MEVVESVSWRRVGVRLTVLVLLVGGTLMYSLTNVMTVAAAVYFAFAAGYLTRTMQAQDRSISTSLTAGGVIVRRELVWIMLGLMTVYLLIIDPAIIRGITAVVLTYVGGVLFQAVRACEQHPHPETATT
jgi:hypothetical protein